MKTLLGSFLFATLLVASVAAQEAKAKRGNRAYPPRLEGARVEVYKTTGDVRLNMYIFTPADHRFDDPAAAIVFFFGGGWRSGSPGQFQEQCRYLAARGMVAMAADYRKTMYKTDTFLTSLGFLDGEPTIDDSPAGD